MVLVVQFGVCYQISRRGRGLQGRHQGLGALLKNLGIRSIAMLGGHTGKEEPLAVTWLSRICQHLVEDDVLCGIL